MQDELAKANGYPYGTVTDSTGGHTSAAARVEFWKSGTVYRTCYLRKAAGVVTWSYSMVITSGTHDVVAADTSVQPSKQGTQSSVQCACGRAHKHQPPRPEQRMGLARRRVSRWGDGPLAAEAASAGAGEERPVQ